MKRKRIDRVPRPTAAPNPAELKSGTLDQKMKQKSKSVTLDSEIDLESIEERLAEWQPDPGWAPRAGRKNLHEKLAAGLRGLKYGLRGDSAFFAHIYRGMLIALAAMLLNVGPTQWCFLIVALSLVFVAELASSAVDTLARALGDEDSPGLTAAREIATAGVLIAVTAFLAVSSIILITRFRELFS